MRGINRYIEDLIRSRRPRRFRATDDEAAMARAAITLRSARPGSGEPAEEFVTALHRRLASELDPPPAAQHADGVQRAVGRRRTFLRAATAVGAVAAGAAGGGIDHLLTAGGSGLSPAAAGTVVPGRGAWLTVANSADLPEGTVRPFTVSALTGFIERAAGQLRAVSGICTHQGCRLTMADRPARLVCPCHGAMFTLDGTVLTHKFPDPLAALPRIEVREADGAVQVYAPLEP